MLRPRRASIRWRSRAILVGSGWRWMASTAAHRTSLLPCLVMCPRRTTVSDSRCVGVKPAHEHRWAGSKYFAFGTLTLTEPQVADVRAALITLRDDLAWRSQG